MTFSRPGFHTCFPASAALLALAMAACGPEAGNDGAPSAAIASTQTRAVAPAQYVIMVSFDGFRHDYIDRDVSPVLDSLARAGVRADGLIPVMPTKTFPNHYAIATGMYAAEHRLTANVFRDSVLGVYSPADRSTVENGDWYGGVPIWVAARRQGLRTASMFWVGTEAPVQGMQPDIWHRFDAAVTPEQRVDSVLSWLRLPPGQRPRLLTLYFDFTDYAGTWNGPDSPGTDSAIAYADRMIGRLVRGTRELPHADSIAILVMSDHGMANVRGAVFLDEYDVPLTDVEAMFHGPFVTFYMGNDSTRIRALRERLDDVPHTHTYARNELPPEWHWADSRTGDLIMVAEPGWLIGRAPQELPAGAHGWSPDVAEMRGVFIASGAGVARGVRIPAFENIHIHAYVAALLGIERGAGSAEAGPLAHPGDTEPL